MIHRQAGPIPPPGRAPYPPHPYGPPPAGLLPPAGPAQRFGPPVAPYPAVGTARMSGPPGPEIAVRPRVVWIALSWLLFALLVIGGVAAFVEPLGRETATGPDRFFRSAQVTDVSLDPREETTIYAFLPEGGYVRCEPVGPAADEVILDVIEGDRSVLVDGREWHAAFRLLPAARGTYQIVCDGAGAMFGLGAQSDPPAPGGGVLALIVLPLTGFVTAVTTTILVLTRRRAAQERLFTPWTGPAYPRRW